MQECFGDKTAQDESAQIQEAAQTDKVFEEESDGGPGEKKAGEVFFLFRCNFP